MKHITSISIIVFATLLITAISCSEQSTGSNNNSSEKVVIFEKFNLVGLDSLNRKFSSTNFLNNNFLNQSVSWESPYKINTKDFDKIVFNMTIDIQGDTTISTKTFQLGLDPETLDRETFFIHDLDEGVNQIEFELENHMFYNENLDIWFITNVESFWQNDKIYHFAIKHYNLKIIGYKK